MNAAKIFTLLAAILTSTQAFGTCSPTISESTAGGNIVITNNCGLSDQEVLNKLDKFKSEQARNNANQNKNQRELIKQFNKNQQETTSKLDQILEKIEQKNAQKATTQQNTEDRGANEIPQQQSNLNLAETGNSSTESNYQTILESIKSHPLIIQEDVVARLIINQRVALDCVKIAEIAIEAKKLNQYYGLSTAFISRIAPQVSQPLKPSCFQELTKGMSAEMADSVITTIKSTTKATTENIVTPKNKNLLDTKKSASTAAPRPIIKSLAAALGNESGGYRIEAVKTSIQSLPNNLTADEILSIIEKETGGYKESLINALLPKIQPNSLDGSKIAKILNPDQGSYRRNHITILAPLIKPHIEAADVTEILEGLHGAQRGEAINLLAEKIKTPLSDESIVEIIGNISGDYRRSAIRALIEVQSASYSRAQDRGQTPRLSRPSRPSPLKLP